MTHTLLQARARGAVGLVIASAMIASSVIAFAAPQDRSSDDTLRDLIAYRLETTASIKKYDLSVKVESHVAVLRGTVATPAQKAEAAKQAHIDGITSVDDQIAVDRDVDRTLADRAKSGMRRSGEAITDSWITTKVKWFLTTDSGLKGSSISVETTNRTVTLSGTVRSSAERRLAIALANDTDGVKSVVDHLVVRP